MSLCATAVAADLAAGCAHEPRQPTTTNQKHSQRTTQRTASMRHWAVLLMLQGLAFA